MATTKSSKTKSSKTKDTNKTKKQADSKKRSDGSIDIKRAEQRLAKALADVDDAREKVQRRERDLTRLMERYGHLPAAIAAADEAIPLEAPSQSASANGATSSDAETVAGELVEQMSEQTAGNDGDEHHE